jgi:glycosyltransferase involved in cell wall biosynthesis
MTNRRNCRSDWFFDSLARQEVTGDPVRIKIVVIDFYAAERTAAEKARAHVWVTPKPTVWQGEHRLTTEDYFAASNARNTALCYADDGLVAFVDDLSVLLPGWLEAALTAERGHVVLGRYAKVKNLIVKEGRVDYYDPFPAGDDSRWLEINKIGRPTRTRVDGGWMFGCSMCGHIDDFLDINGFDEDCDSMGSEDYIAGIMLEKHGVQLWYEPGMRTLESEELHHVEKPFKRIIKPSGKFRGKDASWTILDMVRHGGRSSAPNYCNLRMLRDVILNGVGVFPVAQIPEHDWRDGQPLREM